MQSQGFVTVQHDVHILQNMNNIGHHSIAKAKDQVAGYALFMSKEMEKEIPVLIPMFEQFKSIKYGESTLYEQNFFVMGQVCVAKPFRGLGIFDGLYANLKQMHSGKFDLIVTEVATRNIRSIRAHERVGFETVKIYTSAAGEEWAILVWEIGDEVMDEI